MRPSTFDRIVNWIVIPIGIGCSVIYIAQGSLLAVVSIGWTVTLWLNVREYRGWRNRTNQWTQVEKRDRDRFALEVLTLKSKVVDSLLQTYERAGLLSAEEIVDAMQPIYRDVANTWIPADAPAEYHRLRELAQRAAETGERPQLRIVH